MGLCQAYIEFIKICNSPSQADRDIITFDSTLFASSATLDSSHIQNKSSFIKYYASKTAKKASGKPTHADQILELNTLTQKVNYDNSIKEIITKLTYNLYKIIFYVSSTIPTDPTIQQQVINTVESIKTPLGIEGSASDFIKLFAFININTEVRHIFDHIRSAKSQCEVVYSTFDNIKNKRVPTEFDRGVDVCYICGFVIHDLAECEHVLPVLDACKNYCLLIADSSTRQNQFNDASYLFIKREYYWAHRCCNQAKSDKVHFIKFELNTSGTGEYKFDNNACATAYRNIKKKLFGTDAEKKINAKSNPTKPTAKPEICYELYQSFLAMGPSYVRPKTLSSGQISFSDIFNSPNGQDEFCNALRLKVDKLITYLNSNSITCQCATQEMLYAVYMFRILQYLKNLELKDMFNLNLNQSRQVSISYQSCRDRISFKISEYCDTKTQLIQTMSIPIDFKTKMELITILILRYLADMYKLQGDSTQSSFALFIDPNKTTSYKQIFLHTVLAYKFLVDTTNISFDDIINQLGEAEYKVASITYPGKPVKAQDDDDDMYKAKITEYKKQRELVTNENSLISNYNILFKNLNTYVRKQDTVKKTQLIELTKSSTISIPFAKDDINNNQYVNALQRLLQLGLLGVSNADKKLVPGNTQSSFSNMLDYMKGVGSLYDAKGILNPVLALGNKTDIFYPLPNENSGIVWIDILNKIDDDDTDELIISSLYKFILSNLMYSDKREGVTLGGGKTTIVKPILKGGTIHGDIPISVETLKNNNFNYMSEIASLEIVDSELKINEEVKYDENSDYFRFEKIKVDENLTLISKNLQEISYELTSKPRAMEYFKSYIGSLVSSREVHPVDNISYYLSYPDIYDNAKKFITISDFLDNKTAQFLLSITKGTKVNQQYIEILLGSPNDDERIMFIATANINSKYILTNLFTSIKDKQYVYQQVESLLLSKGITKQTIESAFATQESFNMFITSNSLTLGDIINTVDNIYDIITYVYDLINNNQTLHHIIGEFILSLGVQGVSRESSISMLYDINLFILFITHRDSVFFNTIKTEIYNLIDMSSVYKSINSNPAIYQKIGEYILSLGLGLNVETVTSILDDSDNFIKFLYSNPENYKVIINIVLTYIYGLINSNPYIRKYILEHLNEPSILGNLEIFISHILETPNELDNINDIVNKYNDIDSIYNFISSHPYILQKLREYMVSKNIIFEKANAILNDKNEFINFINENNDALNDIKEELTRLNQHIESVYHSITTNKYIYQKVGEYIVGLGTSQEIVVQVLSNFQEFTRFINTVKTVLTPIDEIINYIQGIEALYSLIFSNQYIYQKVQQYISEAGYDRFFLENLDSFITFTIEFPPVLEAIRSEAEVSNQHITFVYRSIINDQELRTILLTLGIISQESLNNLTYFFDFINRNPVHLNIIDNTTKSLAFYKLISDLISINPKLQQYISQTLDMNIFASKEKFYKFILDNPDPNFINNLYGLLNDTLKQMILEYVINDQSYCKNIIDANQQSKCETIALEMISYFDSIFDMNLNQQVVQRQLTLDMFVSNLPTFLQEKMNTMNTEQLTTLYKFFYEDLESKYNIMVRERRAPLRYGKGGTTKKNKMNKKSQKHKKKRSYKHKKNYSKRKRRTIKSRL